MTPLLKIELHCHTYASGDSLVRPRDLLDEARRKGVDRLAITDHNEIWAALEAQQMDPERVIVGEEILTTNGELLAFFVKEKVPRGLKPEAAIERLREQGAYISVSHPFDRQRHGWALADLEAIAPLVDAVEVFNARCVLPQINRSAQEFAQTRELAGTVGSDAHLLWEVGRATLRVQPFTTRDEFAEAVRKGQMEGGTSPLWVRFGSLFAKSQKRLVKALDARRR